MALTAPTDENLGDWFEVINSWLDLFIGVYQSLDDDSLQRLLEIETSVSRYILAKAKGENTPTAPTPVSVPDEYPILMQGSERHRQTRLALWDRFQTADGVFPAIARFAIAASIIGAVIWFGTLTGMATVTVYNGLNQNIQVSIGDLMLLVGAEESQEFAVPAVTQTLVQATTTNGEMIENFTVDASNSVSQYIYNVAGASPLLEWTEVYGEAEGKPNRELGNQRWLTSSADILFSEPPEQVTSSADGGTRDVLSGLSYLTPDQMSNYLSPKQLANVAKIRARFDSPKSANILLWLNQLDGTDYEEAIETRLQLDLSEFLGLWALKEILPADKVSAYCKQRTNLSRRQSRNADAAFLAARCLDDPAERKSGYLAGYEKWPDHGWFAYRAGGAYAGDTLWELGVDAYTVAFEKEPALRTVIAPDAVRLLRISGRDTPDQLEEIARYSNYITFALAVEGESDLADGFEAYRRLHDGKFYEAIVEAQKRPDFASLMLRLAAASDSADELLVERALALPADQGVDGEGIFYATALALKQGKGAPNFQARFYDAAGTDAAAITDFLNSLSTLEAPSQSEALLLDVSPYHRGIALAMATVYLGTETPVSWRDQAKTLLFESERPFFD
jgi:hypothetical protein